MKNFLLVLALISVLGSCKKDDPEPEPVTPDYADGLVGTYVGTETRYQQDHSTVDYNNATKTMTITKLEKNRVRLTSFESGPTPALTLSERSDGNIFIAPEGFTVYGTNNNVYFNSPKQLNIYIVSGSGSATRYYRFQATKQ